MPSRKDTTTTLVGSTLTHVKYELPPTIKSLQNGWLATFQSSAVISALFAGLEGLLLGLVKDSVGSGSESSSTGQALLAFTYIALFFSISSAMSALILTDEFGDITLRASRSEASGESTLKYDAYDEGSNQLLSRFNGGRQSWRWVMWHCKHGVHASQLFYTDLSLYYVLKGCSL
ncbi:hypothetical protein PHLCEN_2v157 [Hermanssonia centrifuga]|uniref:Uncharacterized protein n=1 Tax=Hermanssonia centrifuga TaxID=98765 RepID=A0A2R6S6R0_9APHY|nr:hypothetical protein PHLCEN_2v157 [Hermanssonia centrifuga]